MTTIIKGDIISDGIVLRGHYLVIDDGKIADITLAQPARPVDLDRTGYTVAPGFIDMHVHGGGGGDFMSGSAESVRQALRTHARFGTTGLLATTLTASRDAVDRAIRSIRDVAKAPTAGEAKILGIHLEGPYICSAMMGAQPPDAIRPPDLDELRHWVELASGTVREITLAPELDGALAFIAAAREMGIVCSVGHTEATSAQTRAAISAGASQGTHLFNRMRGLTHQEPGTVGALLTSPDAVVELICDGFHLNPEIVKIAVAAKSPALCALITDAIEAMELPEGTHHLGGQTVTTKGGAARLDNGALAGSLLAMSRAFRNVQRFAGVGPEAASIMASAVPARQIGVADRKGGLAVGKDADIAIIDVETGDVDTTIIEGAIAYRR